MASAGPVATDGIGVIVTIDGIVASDRGRYISVVAGMDNILRVAGGSCAIGRRVVDDSSVPRGWHTLFEAGSGA